MADGPDVVGSQEAAEILKVRSARVRAALEGRANETMLKAGPVWWRGAVLMVAAGKRSRRQAPKVLGTFEVSQRLSIDKANVRKWTERRELPARRLASNRVWFTRDIERGVLITSPRWRGRV